MKAHHFAYTTIKEVPLFVLERRRRRIASLQETAPEELLNKKAPMRERGNLKSSKSQKSCEKTGFVSRIELNS